jgi:serine/threonine protein kinase
VKIADFGFAKKIPVGQKENVQCGTLSYMAPEVILRNGYECEVDIWSLGVITHQLLTGGSPFNGKDRNQVKNEILTKAVNLNGPSWDTISDHGKSFIRFALEKDQKLRPTARALLDHPWIQNRT